MDIRIGYFIKSPIVNEIYNSLKSDTPYEVVGITAQHVTIESGEGYRTILSKSKLAEQQWEVMKPVKGFSEVKIGDLVDTGNLYEVEYYGVAKGRLYEIERVDRDIDSVKMWFFFRNDFTRTVGVTKEMWDKYGFSIQEKQEPQVATEEPTYQEMRPLGQIEYLSIIALAIDIGDEELQDYYKQKLRELEGAK